MLLTEKPVTNEYRLSMPYWLSYGLDHSRSVSSPLDHPQTA